MTRDFPVHIYNNELHYIFLYLICPPNKGVNRIINNTISGSYYQPIKFMMTYCSSSTPTHNMEHINLHILNNNILTSDALYFDSPQNNNQLNQSYMTILSAGLASYNTGYGSRYTFESGTFPLYSANSSFGTNSNTSVLQMGPGTYNNYNPSAEYLNLDLTPNTPGKEGGSHAFNNYNPSGLAGFNTMTGSKARITYLNLPTLIFDPSNIQIKAKAVHGN